MARWWTNSNPWITVLIVTAVLIVITAIVIGILFGVGVLKSKATAPVTTAPVTSAPVTTAPVTTAPVTTAPVTSAPVTSAPVTTAPVTSAPVTTAPVTTAPVTTAPVTTAPVTTAPVTTAPVTTAPVTTAPVTTAPVTTAPVTTAPVTTAPVTTAPAPLCVSLIPPTFDVCKLRLSEFKAAGNPQLLVPFYSIALSAGDITLLSAYIVSAANPSAVSFRNDLTSEEWDDIIAVYRSKPNTALQFEPNRTAFFMQMVYSGLSVLVSSNYVDPTTVITWNTSPSDHQYAMDVNLAEANPLP